MSSECGVRRTRPPAGGTSRLAGRRPAPIGLPGMPPVHAPWRSPEPLHPLHPTDSGVKSARHLFSTSHPTSVTSDGQWRKVGKTPFFHHPPNRYIRYIRPFFSVPSGPNYEKFAGKVGRDLFSTRTPENFFPPGSPGDSISHPQLGFILHQSPPENYFFFLDGVS